MDRKSKVFLIIVVIAALLLSAHKYILYVEDNSFVVFEHISCDPETELCFVSDCDPSLEEECDVTPYKKIEKIASNIKECEPGDCEELSCSEGEEGCEVYSCSEETVDEGELCTSPEAANAEESQILE